MDRKEKYNDKNIEKAINSLNECIAKIEEELSPEKYKDLINSLGETVDALKRIDQLMPFQSQIKSEIISPISSQLRKSSRSNIAFGWIGFTAAVIGIMIGVFLSYFTAEDIDNLGIKLTNIENQITNNNIKIDQSINDIFSELTIIKLKQKPTSPYSSTIPFVPYISGQTLYQLPNLDLLLKTPNYKLHSFSEKEKKD